MGSPVDIADIRNITISGRIASGATTLAHHLADTLSWEVLDGGKLFRTFMKDRNIPVADTLTRSDSIDLEYEENITRMLQTKSHQIIQSHLAGFDAQGIEGVFKVLLICVDSDGNDKTEIRIDRLSNRDHVSIDDAKKEVRLREEQNLEKWRKLYAGGDKTWVYWDEKYYDLIINTYSINALESTKKVLEKLQISKKR